jgi:Cys-rich protein (TIGR01571 family)
MSPAAENTGTLVTHAAPKSEWNTGLFQFKRPMGLCLYAWCFPCCATASARHEFDDSDFIFNLLTLNPIMARNIIREGYGIQGNACEDILVSHFCQPCAVAQFLEEVRKRGPSHKPGSGKQEWKHGLFSFDLMACLYAWCFPQCAMAESRRRYDDSNFLLNCLCSGIALNRSVIRSGYELEGSCLMDLLLSWCLPVCVLAQALQETKTRGKVSHNKPAGSSMN